MHLQDAHLKYQKDSSSNHSTPNNHQNKNNEEEKDQSSSNQGKVGDEEELEEEEGELLEDSSYKPEIPLIDTSNPRDLLSWIEIHSTLLTLGERYSQRLKWYVSFALIISIGYGIYFLLTFIQGFGKKEIHFLNFKFQFFS